MIIDSIYIGLDIRFDSTSWEKEKHLTSSTKSLICIIFCERMSEQKTVALEELLRRSVQEEKKPENDPFIDPTCSSFAAHYNNSPLIPPRSPK